MKIEEHKSAQENITSPFLVNPCLSRSSLLKKMPRRFCMLDVSPFEDVDEEELGSELSRRGMSSECPSVRLPTVHNA